MRVLITGGAGFFGINCVRYLLAKDFDVVSLDIAAFDYPEIRDVEVITADIRDAMKVSKAMENIDAVVHAAAALPLYSREDIFSTEIEGTRNVLDGALKNGIEKVVFISSTAVYGVPKEVPIREEAPLVGVGSYGEAKIQAEKICEEYRAKGLCVPILRPKTFIGPERLGVFALLYDWAKDGKNFPVLGDGNNAYQLLDVEDLCEATYLVLTKSKEVVNDTFNVGAKEFTTIRGDFQKVLNHAGYEKKIIPLPEKPIKIFLKLLEFFRLSPLYAWIYETAGHDSYVSVEKAERILEFTPTYSNEQALIRNYEWYLQHVEDFEGISGISHRKPWKQGILKLAKNFF